MQKQLLNFLIKNKKMSVSSIIIIALGGTVFISGSFLPALELQNLEKLMLKYTTKIEAHMEQKASQKIFKLLACKGFGGIAAATSFGCNKSNPEENMTPAENAAEGARAAASGEEFTSQIDKFNFNDPQVVDNLAKQGIEVTTDSSGKLTGFKDIQTGQIINENDFLNNQSIADSLNTALPESSVELVSNAEPVLAENGVDFAGLNTTPNETASEVDKTIENTVQDGVIGDSATAAVVNDKSGTPADQQAADQQTASSENSLEKAVNTGEKVLAAGGTELEAMLAAEKSFGLGNSLLVSSLVSSVCTIKNTIATASSGRLINITNLLMRHSGLLFSLADQMKVGNPSSTAVDSFMKILHSKNQSGQNYENSVGFRKSSGLAIMKNSPDVPLSSRPTANSGTLLFNKTNSFISTFIPGAGVVCNVESSPFGGLFNGAMGIAQLFSGSFSLGLTQAGVMGGLLLANNEIQNVILPDIIKYFSAIGLSGIESGPSWVNNAFMGSIISSNRVAQSLGGVPMNNTAANAVAAVATYEQAKHQAGLPLSSRLFAIDNPTSLVSQIILYLPTNVSSFLGDISGYFTNFFSLISKSFADLLMPAKILAATNNQSPGAPYGITTYGLTDAQITRYNPIQNEQYLYGSDTIVLHDKKKTHLTLQRIILTGNPYKYPNGAIDSSSTDLYHCFSQNFTVPSSSSGVAPLNFTGSGDPICGTEGNLDYQNTPPQPITENNVLFAYCQTFKATFPNDNLSDSDCESQLSTQYNDDIGRFSQYILDSAIANNYYSMMSYQ